MKRLPPTMLTRLTLTVALSTAAAAWTITYFSEPSSVLEAETNRPATNTFAAGDIIRIFLTAKGLEHGGPSKKLMIEFTREHGEALSSNQIVVSPDQRGTWQTTIPAPIDPRRPLGFYRASIKLDDGTQLAPHGSRPAGYLTYAIVPDPSGRREYGEAKSRFGMMGGFSEPARATIPMLGVRWIVEANGWPDLEPSLAGELQKLRSLSKVTGKPFPPPNPLETTVTYGGHKWAVYGLSTPLRASLPVWASRDKETKGSDCTAFAALDPKGESDWGNFAEALAKARAEDFPDSPFHLYQIGWEPAIPWCYNGTAAQLLSFYSVAYARIHKADPKAKIIGPTLFPDVTGPNMTEIKDLWAAGLAKYVDAFSMHPYWKFPPESTGFIEALRLQREMANKAKGATMDFYGTEHGIATKSALDEIDQARGDIRQTLIVLGEGAAFDLSFYIMDVPEKIGTFGYYYNLDDPINHAGKRLSPKPVAPALAAMTLILDGSDSSGPVKDLRDRESVGYKFSRDKHTILALWNYGSAKITESIKIPASSARIYDWMGNVSVASPTNQYLKIALGPEPIYVQYQTGTAQN